MKSSVSASWKAVAILMMILTQVITGSVCATALATPTIVATGSVATMHERGGHAESKVVVVSDADHHLRCDHRGHDLDLADLRYHEGLRFFFAADALRESVNYLISRPPKLPS